jgi:hypothetical protein
MITILDFDKFKILELNNNFWSDVYEGHYVIFKDLNVEYFGDYKNMVEWLNQNLINKKVNFITDERKVLDNSGNHWIVEKYTPMEDLWTVYVRMKGGASGRASGLVYLDEEVGELLPKIKKFKKIYKPDIDPYGEDYWGTEGIEI